MHSHQCKPDPQWRAGDNTLVGSWGNDTLNGGTGADTMSGGDGNDTYYVDNAGDVVTEVGGPGHRHRSHDAEQLRSCRQCRKPRHRRHQRPQCLRAIAATTRSGATLPATSSSPGDGNDTIHSVAATATGSTAAQAPTPINGGAGDDSYVFDNVGDKVLGEVANGRQRHDLASVASTWATRARSKTCA